MRVSLTSEVRTLYLGSTIRNPIPTELNKSNFFFFFYSYQSRQWIYVEWIRNWNLHWNINWSSSGWATFAAGGLGKRNCIHHQARIWDMLLEIRSCNSPVASQMPILPVYVHIDIIEHISRVYAYTEEGILKGKRKRRDLNSFATTGGWNRLKVG